VNVVDWRGDLMVWGLTGFFVMLPGGRNAVALARDAYLRRKMRAEDGAHGWFSVTGLP